MQKSKANKEKNMFISDEQLFCEELDTSIPELENIGETFKEKGLAAAEKQLSDYVRAVLKPDKYFRIPYYGRENRWARDDEDDLAAANRIVSGELMSVDFAYKFPDGKITDWTFNPTYNSYREWTWQLQRHHEFRCLGRVYRDTGDEKYAKCFVDLLMSWCEQAIRMFDDDKWRWHCWRTIESGIRMTKNWHYALYAFYKSPYMTDHVMTTFIKAVYEHGEQLRSFYTGTNFLYMEMAGLSHIGMIYKWFKKADEWQSFAFDMLQKQLHIQIYPDGFQNELTTNYHGVVIENIEWVLNTAMALEIEAPKALFNSMSELFGVYLKLCQPNRKIPDLNDGNCRDLYAEFTDALKYAPYREDFKYIVTDGKEGKAPDFTSIVLPYSGMATMRNGWDKNDVWFFMESAPFGTFAHQHEDKLNVLMFAYGKDVLRDVGNYDYDFSEMHKFVKDTRSHNCAMVDGQSQNRRGRYKWNPEDINKRSDLLWSFTDEYDTVEGVYNEGYGADYIDVTHTRKAIFFKKGLNGTLPFAVIIDRLVSNDGKEHNFAVSYQTDVQAYKLRDKTYTADFGDGVTFSIISSECPEAVVAQKTPYWLGWRPIRSTAAAHEHAPAPCLRYPYTGKEQRLLTVLYPSNNGEVAIKAADCESSVSETSFTLTLGSGEKITLDEKDFPVDKNAPESFLLAR